MPPQLTRGSESPVSLATATADDLWRSFQKCQRIRDAGRARQKPRKRHVYSSLVDRRAKSEPDFAVRRKPLVDTAVPKAPKPVGVPKVGKQVTRSAWLPELDMGFAEAREIATPAARSYGEDLETIIADLEFQTRSSSQCAEDLLCAVDTPGSPRPSSGCLVDSPVSRRPGPSLGRVMTIAEDRMFDFDFSRKPFRDSEAEPRRVVVRKTWMAKTDLDKIEPYGRASPFLHEAPGLFTTHAKPVPAWFPEYPSPLASSVKKRYPNLVPTQRKW
mmetsp:Transcript_10424/g.22880  ORF Transcript_10424/g.22880 Transcript_10424/m.22880 type:complete len:273 (+) Transcript_10424:96-914(+)